MSHQVQPAPESAHSVQQTSVGVMPDLRIVPIGALVPHEEHDAQRSEPLIERIRDSGVWLNPPIVAEMGDGRYVILDGANRHFALGALGYPHILVQVVEYESESVRLETWHHVVSGVSWFELLRHIHQIDGLSVDTCDLLGARAALARRDALAYVVLRDEGAYLMRAELPTASLDQRNRLLRSVVDTYKRSGILNRVTTDRLSAARRMYPDAVAIVVFPHYEPVEIVVAAREGAHLPPGITRHLIQGRALRLNYPLAALRDESQPLAQKNDDLQRWTQERIAAKRVRYYAEATYNFDE
ncbi:MAG: hypothetical protein ACYDBJ_03690 [Aggregatilineales bacterium]